MSTLDLFMVLGLLPVLFISMILTGSGISFSELMMHGCWALIVALILELWKQIWNQFI